MKFLKKLFGPKELRAALGILDELECIFENDLRSRMAFSIVRRQVELMIVPYPKAFVEILRTKQMRVREWVIVTVGNIAGDHAESGKYHVYRGALNPIGPGEGFVKIFDEMLNELTRLGTHGAEKAERIKASLRECIETVG